MLKTWLGAGVFCGFAALPGIADTPKFPQPSGEPILLEHGLSGALIYQDYLKWLDRQISNRIEDVADTQAFLDGMGVMLGHEAHAVSWWTGGTEMLDYDAGGIGFVCRKNDEPSEMSLFATSEQVAEKCDWKLWRIEFDPKSDVFSELTGDAFELSKAADWVSSQNLALNEIGDGFEVDWSEFPDIGDLSVVDKATRQTTWSSASCPAITDLLSDLEGKQPAAIDIPKFGLDDKTNLYEVGWLSGEVVISSVNGVEITYGFGSDSAQKLLTQINETMETCPAD